MQVKSQRMTSDLIKRTFYVYNCKIDAWHNPSVGSTLIKIFEPAHTDPFITATQAYATPADREQWEKHVQSECADIIKIHAADEFVMYCEAGGKLQ